MLRRRGFTLVELLVVMAVIATLLVLAIPAANRVREAANRTRSAYNLRQIQLGIANYESHHGYFPPSWKPTDLKADGTQDGWSVLAVILPHIEQDTLFGNIDFSQPYGDAPKVKTADGREVALQAMRVPTYISPSEPRDEPRLENGLPIHYPLNYAVNCGTWFVWDPATGRGGDGAFYPNSRLTAGDFRDGLSYTLGCAEVKAYNAYYRNAALSDPAMPATPQEAAELGGDFKSNSGHTEWVDGRAHQIGFTTTFTPNTRVLSTEGGVEYDIDWTNQQEGKSATVKTYAAITARSHHDGGVFVSMMDGSVRFVSNAINRQVWQALSTRAGGELLPADENLPELLETEEEEPAP